MSNEMSVSVVIPAYRAARTIGHAVQSVLGQTVPATEIIVVDDGSPDDLAAALAPFGAAVTLVRKTNGGAASARNLGIEMARGNLLAFLDADDYWAPQKLQRQLAVLAQYPHVGVVGCRWYEEDAATQQRKPGIATDLYFDAPLRLEGVAAFELAMRFWTSAMVFRRWALDGQRFCSGLEPAEDRDLWIRIAATQSIFLLPDILATYVQEPNSLSNGNVDRDCGNMLRVVRRSAKLLGRRGLRRQEAVVFRRWAAGQLSRGNGIKSLRPALERLWREPIEPQAWWIVAKSLAMAGNPRRSR